MLQRVYLPQRRKNKLLRKIARDGSSLYNIPAPGRYHKDIVLAAVRQNGHLLGEAAPRLRRDRDVVLAAVQQSGGALQFVEEKLQRDPHVIIAACKKNGDALPYVPLDAVQHILAFSSHKEETLVAKEFLECCDLIDVLANDCSKGWEEFLQSGRESGQYLLAKPTTTSPSQGGGSYLRSSSCGFANYRRRSGGRIGRV